MINVLSNVRMTTVIIATAAVIGLLLLSTYNANNALLQSPSVFAQQQNETAFHPYDNPTYGIFMQYPSNWTASTSGLTDYTDVIAFYSPRQNVSDLFPARFKISVVQYSQNISLPDYKNFTLSILNQSQQFTLINSSDITVAGYPGYRIVLTNKPFPNDPLIVYSMNIATAVGNKIYLINYDGQELAFNKHLPEVGRMLESMIISGGR
jgi:PsbP-like protein